MLAQDGIATAADLASVLPAPERMERGPVAVAECFQNIPCDPCYHSCKQGAIEPFQDINERPRIDQEKCTGCGLCMSRCPGLAIFVVDGSYAEDRSLVKIPYEFLPLPQAGDTVEAVNRAGRTVGEARVVKVQNGPIQDRTAIVWLAVAKELVLEVRHFKVKGVR